MTPQRVCFGWKGDRPGVRVETVPVCSGGARRSQVCSYPGFLLVPRKNYLSELQGNLMQKQYLLAPVTWKVMQRNVWEDVANLRIKQLSNDSKSQRHASMTITHRNTLRCKNEFFAPIGARHPSEVGVFFWGICCSFEFSRDRHCHGTGKCPHRLSSDELLRVAVPSQLRVSLHAWQLPRRFKNASELWRRCSTPQHAQHAGPHTYTCQH